jgi:hypothetical protein
MRRFFQMAAFAVLTLGQLEANIYDYDYYDCQECGNSNQWSFQADFLWWRGVLDNLPSVIVIESDGENNTSADIHYPNFKWKPGVRLGVGFTPCGCDWSIGASWTHWQTKARKHLFRDDPNETISPQWGSLLPFIADAADIDTEWRLYINWLDLELNKLICESSCFQFDIHGGLRTLWVDHKFHFSAVNAIASNNLHSKNKLSSIGIVAGLDANWKVGCGFSINVGAGGALLYGKNKSSVSETLIEEGIFDFISGSSNYWITRAMSDLKIGFSWESRLLDCMTLILAFDWEHHYFFDQNQLPRGSRSSASRPRDGDLSLQGVTLSARVFF